MQSWTPISLPDPKDKPDAFKFAVRLNSLGSLYFFEKFTLQRGKLSETFHKPILTRLEIDYLRYLLEAPRDHYKTVMVTEGRNMWRSLPFTALDEQIMGELGYDEEFLARMKRIHNPGRRTLIVSEVLANAIKLGWRIDWHFRENELFKLAFSDILPTAKETWTNESKQQKAANRGPQGEGTFDFIGVGGALQSRHYTDVDEDDVVGKEAWESEIVMEKTIDYHKLLIGAFESFATGAWMVVNNRWAPRDLSWWIRANQPEFVIESHGALGGCDPVTCPDEHTPGKPIFPEEYTIELLENIRTIQGPYVFSHQYLNLPVAPEECVFKPEWLRYYDSVPAPVGTGSPGNPNPHWMRHELLPGEKAVPNMNPNMLVRTMIVDPNHAGSNGRARHAIVVTGLDPESGRIYLLDVWAESQSYDALMTNVYKMATLWGLTEFWLETVAAQKYLKYHIEWRNKVEKRALRVNELKSSTGANAKRTRIESLEPILRSGKLWARHDQSQFLNEYMAYPGGQTVDILDCLGYGTQTWNAHHARKISEITQRHRNRFNARKTHTGY